MPKDKNLGRNIFPPLGWLSCSYNNNFVMRLLQIVFSCSNLFAVMPQEIIAGKAVNKLLSYPRIHVDDSVTSQQVTQRVNNISQILKNDDTNWYWLVRWVTMMSNIHSFPWFLTQATKAALNPEPQCFNISQ